MNIYFFLFACYMLAPKFDLFAGFLQIRPEDVISLIAAVLYVSTPRRMKPQFSTPVKLYLVFVGINFLSAIINLGTIGLLGFVFSARLLQYMLWYFILYEACHEVTWQTMRRTFLVISAVFIAWGVLEFTGAIGAVGKFTGASERLTINTSGPFETSVMLAMLAYSLSNVVVAAPLLVLVFLTQSRVTLVGMVFSYFHSRPFRAVAAGMLMFVAYTTLAQPILSSIQDTRVGQSEGLSRMSRAFVESWRRAPVLEDPTFFREHLLDGTTIFRYMVDTKGDMSFRYRAVRWPTLIKTTLNNPRATIIGWSPAAWSNALDNYYVRVFGETGLVGLAAFLLWLGVTMWRVEGSGVVRYSLVMMAVVALFIDIFTSSKVMPLLWMFLAVEDARHPFAIPQKKRPGLRFRRPRDAPVAPQAVLA